MPIYTRPLHEFRLCKYCEKHEIPFYLPLVPGFKIHNLSKGQKRYTYKKEIMKPMLSSYIFAQMTEDQKKQIWRSNSINGIWDVTIEEQPKFVDELHGLQMMESLALSTKLEFKREIQVNDRLSLMLRGNTKGLTVISWKNGNVSGGLSGWNSLDSTSRHRSTQMTLFSDE